MYKTAKLVIIFGLTKKVFNLASNLHVLFVPHVLPNLQFGSNEYPHLQCGKKRIENPYTHNHRIANSMGRRHWLTTKFRAFTLKSITTLPLPKFRPFLVMS
jgi:hypothetical protein